MAHHAPHRQIASLERIRNEPSTLDADMTPADIANTLKRLKFDRRGGAQILKVADPEVRDYLVGCITRQGERSR